MLALQSPPTAPVQRIEGLPSDLESLGYAVAVVRDPVQRTHVELAISAPRLGYGDGATGWAGATFLVDLRGRRVVERRDGINSSGLQVEWLGDADGDHRPDFAMLGGDGVWWARSSAKVMALWSHPEDASWSCVGASSIGDTDGDGARELAAVMRSRPSELLKERAPTFRFELWSGSHGRVVRRVELPSVGDVPCAPVEIGDVDGDAQSDFALLSDPSCSKGAAKLEVWIVSSLEGVAPSRVPIALSVGDEHFLSVADVAPTLGVLGDLDGDSVDEVLVGVVVSLKLGGATRGLVLAVDVRRRSLSWAFACPIAPKRTRCDARGGSDIDGDGTPDVLVRDVGERRSSPVETQRLLVLSGREGGQIREHASPIAFRAEFPHCAEFVSDLDGDGADEYLTTETCGYIDVSGAHEKVRVFSGRTGEELLRFP
ncbi:MAG: hypothetical protein IT453_04945 [Planctomycetes bacterium]|nr:hypothetical protein [Planctomycetota bacterium]